MYKRQLLRRPDAGLDDLWVQADRDPETGVGVLTIEVTADDAAFPVRVRCDELELDLTLNLSLIHI